MRFKHLIRGLCYSGVAATVISFTGLPLHAQFADDQGFILSHAWLVAGPFANDNGCQTTRDVFLQNHIAPSHIACQYPGEGDEIEYDPTEAASTGYIPDFEEPVWRLFDESGFGSRDLNLDGDINGDVSDAMSWLVTYVENTGEAPVVVEFCLGSDDDNQLWVNETYIETNVACRGRADCQDRAAAVFEPGVNRIAFGIWENGGGWGGSLALSHNGEPITDESDGFALLGTEGGEPRPDCEGPEVEDIQNLQPVVALACDQNLDGSVELRWMNPAENDAAVEIRIVHGDMEITVPGDSTSTTVGADTVDDEIASFCVINYSGLPTCCQVLPSDAPLTTSEGHLIGHAFLALGPISTQINCAGSLDDLLGNHIAPSLIACEYPEEGDETVNGVDFDDPENVANGFHPDTTEAWRRFDDGTPDNGDQDMDADIAGNLDDHMTWLITYVEYQGDPTTISLCLGSDDDIQVWMNDKLVHNNNSCRGRALSCQDTAVIDDFEPGVYRIAMAVWENGGGWGGSIAIHDEFNTPVVDGENDEWIFHGRSRPEGFEGPCPDCDGAVENLTCERNGDGSVLVSWDNPGGCSDAITISAVGEVVGTVSSDVTEFTIAAEDMPLDGAILVDNGSIAPAICSTIEANELHTDQGFVSAWLHLGPFGQQDGDNPGCDLMRMDHLTDGETTELNVEPVAGDQIETDYSPGEAASLGLNPAEVCFDCNPDGIPTWQEFTDVGDQFDVNALVSGADNQMSYGMFYIDVAEDVTVDVGVASDDAIQVLAGEVGDEITEIHCNSVARGVGGANSVQDVIRDVELTQGQWKFMVKVFEGGGGHGWRLRFQKGGQPLLPGEISLEPADVPPTGAPLRPGDVNGDAAFNIADMVALLNFLFGGATLPECYVMAGGNAVVLNPTGGAILDYNGDGPVNIADAVAGLAGLFSGGAPHALGENCVQIPGTCAPNCVDG